MGSLELTAWTGVDATYTSSSGTHSYSFNWHVNTSYKSFVARTVDLVITPLSASSRRQDIATFAWPQNLREGLGNSKPNVRAFLDEAFQKAAQCSIRK